MATGAPARAQGFWIALRAPGAIMHACGGRFTAVPGRMTPMIV